MLVHPDFHWPNILATNFHKFHWQIFNFFASFVNFLRLLHLNNLCRKSIAQTFCQWKLGDTTLFSYAMPKFVYNDYSCSQKVIYHFVSSKFGSFLMTIRVKVQQSPLKLSIPVSIEGGGPLHNAKTFDPVGRYSTPNCLLLVVISSDWAIFWKKCLLSIFCFTIYMTNLTVK